MSPKMTATALAISFLCSMSYVTVEADGRRGFSERDIRGSYSVTFDGEVTEGPLVGHVVAVGRVTSDGRGNFEFGRTLNVGGLVSVEQTGVCRYNVNPDGRGRVACTVRTEGQPDTQETFALTVVDRTEVDFISTTPGSAVLGVGKKQSGGSDEDD